MMVVNIELRKYALEIAMHDMAPANSRPIPDVTNGKLEKEAEAWMSEINDPNVIYSWPWRHKSNAGYVHGVVFDSNLDITVKDDKGNVLDHFKGSDCFDLTYTYMEYSMVPIRLWAGQIYGGRIAGMEVTKDCVQTYSKQFQASQYSRDKLHFGLNKVLNITVLQDNACGWYTSNEAYVVDINKVYHCPSTCCINANLPTFSAGKLKYKKVFNYTYTVMPPIKYKEANAEDCDSLYKYIISKGEFK